MSRHYLLHIYMNTLPILYIKVWEKYFSLEGGGSLRCINPQTHSHCPSKPQFRPIKPKVPARQTHSSWPFKPSSFTCPTLVMAGEYKTVRGLQRSGTLDNKVTCPPQKIKGQKRCEQGSQWRAITGHRDCSHRLTYTLQQYTLTYTLQSYTLTYALQSNTLTYTLQPYTLTYTLQSYTLTYALQSNTITYALVLYTHLYTTALHSPIHYSPTRSPIHCSPTHSPMHYSPTLSPMH